VQVLTRRDLDVALRANRCLPDDFSITLSYRFSSASLADQPATPEATATATAAAAETAAAPSPIPSLLPPLIARAEKGRENSYKGAITGAAAAVPSSSPIATAVAPPLPEGWRRKNSALYDAPFYWHAANGVSTWDTPR